MAEIAESLNSVRARAQWQVTLLFLCVIAVRLCYLSSLSALAYKPM